MKLPSSWVMVGLSVLVSTVIVVMSSRHTDSHDYKPELSQNEQSILANIRVQKAQLEQRKLDEKERMCKNAIADAKREADTKARGLTWYGPKSVIPDECLPKQAAPTPSPVPQQATPTPVVEAPTKAVQVTSSAVVQEPVKQAAAPLPVQPSKPEPVAQAPVAQSTPPPTEVKVPKVAPPPKPQAQGVNAIYKRQDVVPGQKTGGVNDTYGAAQVKQGEQAMDAWADKLKQH